MCQNSAEMAAEDRGVEETLRMRECHVRRKACHPGQSPKKHSRSIYLFTVQEHFLRVSGLRVYTSGRGRPAAGRDGDNWGWG